MRIPFIKAQAAGNDFLFTWEADAPRRERAEAARAICSRHAGVGADGWYVVTMPGLEPEEAGYDAAIHLYNSDGSEAELSGNGTRCAAAILVETTAVRPNCPATARGARRPSWWRRAGLPIR